METTSPEATTIQQKFNTPTADRVLITYYTDPLCCWSWAMEAHWRAFREEFAAIVKWKYVMGGMIQDWASYNDPLNAVNKPQQFGPVWMHASQISGVKMNTAVWHLDPPASSFPSCIAVKCADLQSDKASELMLNGLREAIMIKGLNVARESVILSTAKEISEASPDVLNYDNFLAAWTDGLGINAFRRDLEQTRFLKIGRYPTLTFTDGSARGIILTGYRPCEVLRDALHHMLKVKTSGK